MFNKNKIIFFIDYIFNLVQKEIKYYIIGKIILININNLIFNNIKLTTLFLFKTKFGFNSR